MNPVLQFDFNVDKEKNCIHVTREFAAELPMVWAAWTEPELLDLWWAPKPYYAQTKSMDFKTGGAWLYCMVAPDGAKHWCRADYELVDWLNHYIGEDAFCDENGEVNPDFPRSKWSVSFSNSSVGTTVQITVQYKQLADLEKIVQLGFKEGFTMALGNLDHYFAAQGKLRKAMKQSNTQRVSTYLNFPGNTEEAFLFYQSVFGGEFNGGIHRFGEIPADPNQPPMPDTMKNLVLHIELPITGNHILMATDAPKEMGFTVTEGNNMHINLEPDSREEASRIFEALSAGGKITMPLQDMFWGAYFGSFTDKFGINWMVNYSTAG